jgi:hypothetical protein
MNEGKWEIRVALDQDQRSRSDGCEDAEGCRTYLETVTSEWWTIRREGRTQGGVALNAHPKKQNVWLMASELE